MLTGVTVMPKLVSLGRLGFRPTPMRTGSGGGLCAVPVGCQNEAGTTDIERHPDDDRIGRDQEGSAPSPIMALWATSGLPQ